MSVVLVTGSAGLVGSEAVRFFCSKGYDVVGIDNNMREVFFGSDASTLWNQNRLLYQCPTYQHLELDIRDFSALERVFSRYVRDITLVIHAAAQPSHDFSATEPYLDFSVNAAGTANLLEVFRKHCPDAVFIFISSNKVYGDRPNQLPLEELSTRYDLPASHPGYAGIDESMSIDHCLHTVFGASKVAADVLTQEYGRYFGLKTGVFRSGCLTGPTHSGTMLHGFLSYLMKCCISGETYSVHGYKGKQVRDNIHARDLVRAFDHFLQAPRAGEVYNMGGGRGNSVSVIEAIRLCENISGRKLHWSYVDQNRVGDHIWWISDAAKFRGHFPNWQPEHPVDEILAEIYRAQKELYSVRQAG